MIVEITEEELHEIAKAFMILGESPLNFRINWEVVAKFLAKLDK